MVMKKAVKVFIYGLVLVFFGCKKTRTCTCGISQTLTTTVSYNSGSASTSNVLLTHNTEVKSNNHIAKEDARQAFNCYNRNESYTDISTAYSGTLITTTTLDHSDDYSCVLK